jgi:multidrug resistance efflux pump
MDLLLILTYSAFCVVIFKAFKIPLNKWTVPTAVLGGIVLIGSLIFLMNYNHPFSERARKYSATTPIVPTVTGKVIEVPVTANKMLEKGEVLFRINPTVFEGKVNSLSAQVVSAKEDLSRAKTLVKRGAGSVRDRDIAQSRVDDLEAQLAVAQFNLDETVVRAPTRGFATQIILRPGMMAASLPLRPVMIFVHEESDVFVGWFRQNSLLRLNKGDEAEIAFDGIPGVVFGGVVEDVFPLIAEGQVQPNGTVIGDAGAPGRVPVRIRITDERFAEYQSRLPGGAFGQAALYSEHFQHVAVMRKILLRMSSWMNYFFPFH